MAAPSPIGINYSYNDVPTIAKFAACDSFIRGLQGGFRSGKSSGCVIEIMRRAVCQRPSPDGIRRTRWVVVRNTGPQLEDTTIRTFHMWVPPQHFGRYYESDHTYLIKGMPGCEIEVLFRALDRPEHIKNLLSLEVTGAWVNEAREVPWPIIETLQGRVGQYPPKSMNGCTWGGLFMDTNPPDVDSKWYKFFEETKHDPSFAQIFKQPSGLGPDAENLSNLTSPNYYKNLATGKSAEWVKVYIHGEYGFIIDGKPVFPEFKDATHCKAVEPVSGRPVYRTLDFGLTPACVFSQVLPDGRWLVFDEMNSESMGIDRFSDEVLEHSAASFPRGAEFIDIGDPSGNSRAQTDERTCFEILQKKGIDIQPGEITVTLRLESVRKVLNSLVGGEPRFVLHPRCSMLRKGFLGGYQYRRLQVSAERYTAVPDKGRFSHCFPAGTKISTDTGPHPIEQLSVGDCVATPLGPRRVLAVTCRYANSLVKLETSGGKTLLCTPEHEIWSEGGFVRADALQYGAWLNAAQTNTQFRNFWVSDTTGSLLATISLAVRRLRICTALFGSITTARSQQSTTSTTRTTIAGTTRQRIWSALASLSTYPRTPWKGIAPILSAVASTWRQFVPRLLSGTAPLLAAYGTGNTQLKPPPTDPFATTSASSAGEIIRLKRGPESLAIARPLANRLLDATAASTMRIERAASAAKVSASIGMQEQGHAERLVQRSCVKETWPVLVYDLTVEDAHCFYANGILVSNCHDALQYAAAHIFGGGLTTRQDEMEDFGSLGYRQDDRGRSSITGY